MCEMSKMPGGRCATAGMFLDDAGGYCTGISQPPNSTRLAAQSLGAPAKTMVCA